MALFGEQAGHIDEASLTERFVQIGQQVRPLRARHRRMLRAATASGQRVLFEGGQGSMLDIDHGTFPFVTSSSVSACGVPTGAGVPPSAVGHVVGLNQGLFHARRRGSRRWSTAPCTDTRGSGFVEMGVTAQGTRVKFSRAR